MERAHHKIVVITGCSTGSGEETARRYYKKGATVVIIDEDADKGQELAYNLGERAFYLRLDVSDPNKWDNLRAEINARFGEVYDLMDNRGCSLLDQFSEVTKEYYSENFND